MRRPYVDYEDDESELPLFGDRVFRSCTRGNHRKRENKRILGKLRHKSPHASAKLDCQYNYYMKNRDKLRQIERERQERKRISNQNQTTI